MEALGLDQSAFALTKYNNAVRKYPDRPHFVTATVFLRRKYCRIVFDVGTMLLELISNFKFRVDNDEEKNI